jgi:hypothetical protein
MLKQLKQALRDIGVGFFRLIGSEIRDCRTGKRLGRGLVFWWGGRLHLLGCDCALVPVPIPQERLTYWKQSIGFTAHPEVDFSSARPVSAALGEPKSVLLVLLDHRDPESVEKTIFLWTKAGFHRESLLLAYGGSQDAFQKISHSQKFLLTESKHKTSDHQRERQSYREIFFRTTNWLKGRSFTHILFQEYDHLPMVTDLPARMLRCLAAENADILAYHLGRVDASTNPHWLSTVSETYDQPVALSMLGTGHFWRREAWESVAADNTLADWYLELDLPTTAHRLGYRLREIPSQGKFVQNLEINRPSPTDAMASGAWSLHPVKDAQTFAIVEKHLNMQHSYSTCE